MTAVVARQTVEVRPAGSAASTDIEGADLGSGLQLDDSDALWAHATRC
jgi:hypothetical protein